jgi:membrane protein implicated in regulation of membrane protease activity
MGQALVVIGLIIAAVGAAIWLGVPLGRLPGDVVVQRPGFSFYLPITTCLVLSAVLSLIGWLLRR